MEQIKLDVQLRTDIGSSKARQVRRENFIPAIVYGGGSKPTMIKADRKAYDRIHRQHMGESLIYHLNVVDGAKKVADFPAIIKDIQLHPVTDEVIHLDFSRISLDKEIDIKIKIILHGEAIGVKRDGGTIDHLLRELDVVCLPTNIPHHIDADISNLGIHDSIHVKDLKLPQGVRTKHDLESVVVTVAGSMREETAAPAGEGEAAAAGAEPEVLKEKKKEEAPAGDAKKAEPAKKEEKK